MSSMRCKRCGRRSAVLVVLLVAATTGCVDRRGGAAEKLAEDRSGLVYLFPGIDGGDFSLCFARAGIEAAGLKAEIRIFEWASPFDPLGNLQNIERNRADARRVAGELAEYRAAHPDAPLSLVGYSGGGGIAVLVAEALSDDVRLRQLLLVQPALSPTYDLRPALRHVEGRIVNFYSPNDWLVLGLGTSVFGNIDRAESPAAGKEGFDAAAALPDERERVRLKQVRWSGENFWQGHWGGHLGILTYEWNRRVVGPALLECGAGDGRAPSQCDARAAIAGRW